MDDRLLSFELSPDGTTLDIHGNADGLSVLQNAISRAIEQNSHEHLMSPSWAGDELTEEPQGQGTTVLKKVTIHIWD